MSENAASGINLTDLFSKRVFRIPDYQRGYAWGERQLTELWQDIKDIETDGKGGYRSHYTGTIYVEDMVPPDEDAWLIDHHYYTVVDGQQRLTTISILLFELWKAIGDDFEYKEEMRTDFLVRENKTHVKRVYKFSYLGGQERYLQKVIFEDKSILGEYGTETVYTRNLIAAKKFFSDKIAGLTRDGMCALYAKLVTSLRFDFRPINDLDVQAVFETMNNRGKPLTVLEKLKNRLMYLSERLDVEPGDVRVLRGQINDTWGHVYRKLGENPTNILDEDEFISAHLSLYRKPTEPTFSTQIAEKKLFEMFSNHAECYPIAGDEKELEPKVDFTKIQEYITDLDRFAECWFEVNNSERILERKILILNRSKEIKIFLCALHAKTCDEDALAGALSRVERVLFRNRVPGAYFKDEGTFATMARAVYNGETDVQSAMSELDVEMKNAVIDPANIAHAFAGLFDYQRGPKGFHRWNALRYFLFEYEECRRREVKEYGDIIDITEYGNASVEHIIPQDYANWKDVVATFAARISPEMDKGDGYAEKVLINTLGNLMLIRAQKNSSLQNDPWTIKRLRYETGTYNEREVASNTQWTAIEVFERGNKLFNFLLDKLGIARDAWTRPLLNQALYNNDYIAAGLCER